MSISDPSGVATVARMQTRGKLTVPGCLIWLRGGGRHRLRSETGMEKHPRNSFPYPRF